MMDEEYLEILRLEKIDTYVKPLTLNKKRKYNEVEYLDDSKKPR